MLNKKLKQAATTQNKTVSRLGDGLKLKLSMNEGKPKTNCKREKVFDSGETLYVQS
jgi:hypothetical protein